MKKTLIGLLILPALLLSSCSLFTSIKETVEKEIMVYDLDNIPSNQDISKGYQDTINARFVKGQDYIPYLTIEDYISLYLPHFKPSIESNVEVDGSSTVWTVSGHDGLVFVAEFNMTYRALLLAGSLEEAYREDDNQQDLEALNHAMETDYVAEERGSGYASYYFSSIDCFKYEGKWYLPLGFYDIAFSGDTNLYYFYNYAHIFSTRDVENYAYATFKENKTEYTVDSQMSASKKDANMPEYLIKYNASLFIFLMNNFYGLKEYYGIDSMTLFYKNKVKLYNNLLSKNAAVRAQAYADALDVFDDNHTALVSANDTWGENKFANRLLSPGIRERSLLRNTLNSTRDAYYAHLFPNQEVEPGDEIIYSQDGKTAMYMFNSFEFTTGDVLHGNDLEKLYKEDTFMNLVYRLNTIKNKGGVENVILDISTNGGGVVGVMLKLLALLSKNNKTKVTYKDGATGTIASATCRVDTNSDDRYDALDSFGNTFNFYILTSDCSFSCANAFPCIAQLEGIAKIIGQKSGGGECAVAIHYLPNSQYVYHSSNIHLGYYDSDNKEFTGFEQGATPDIEISNTDDFYDIEKLNSLIASAQK